MTTLSSPWPVLVCRYSARILEVFSEYLDTDRMRDLNLGFSEVSGHLGLGRN